MIHSFFPLNPKKAPTKKFRGRKRYFKSVIQKATIYSPSLGPDDWYDMWHYHADWEGYGNSGWKYRAKHIEALSTVFRKLTAELDHLHKPHQLFICLNREDSGQDAVYFHTPNPNCDNFPCHFPDAHWGIPTMESYFSSMLSLRNIRAGRKQWLGAQIFLVYSPGIGEALE
jgi:hypothetical protein